MHSSRSQKSNGNSQELNTMEGLVVNTCSILGLEHCMHGTSSSRQSCEQPIMAQFEHMNLNDLGSRAHLKLQDCRQLIKFLGNPQKEARIGA